MTDYETARLTLQQASVEIGRASVWATYVQAGVALVIGLAQCGLIYVGLRRMGKPLPSGKPNTTKTWPRTKPA